MAEFGELLRQGARHVRKPTRFGVRDGFRGGNQEIERTGTFHHGPDGELWSRL